MWVLQRVQMGVLQLPLLGIFQREWKLDSTSSTRQLCLPPRCSVAAPGFKWRVFILNLGIHFAEILGVFANCFTALPRDSKVLSKSWVFTCMLVHTPSAAPAVVGLACLTKLHLFKVDITGDELGCFLSNSFAIEELNLIKCGNVIHLKIPCLLRRLNCLVAQQCRALKVIENKAPNLWIVRIDCQLEKVLVGDVLQVKDLRMLGFYESDLVHYARTKLPFIIPNLETLSLRSAWEMFNTPTLRVKFLYLKNLRIYLNYEQRTRFPPRYDYLSLVSFLDACPVLENFVLAVSQTRVNRGLISGDPHLRQMPEHRHDNIKNVTIKGFCAAKSMVELTCHILENATSPECLTLDTELYDGCEDPDKTCANEIGRCYRLENWRMIDEPYRGLWAIERCIVGKVPSTVKLNVNKLRSWRYAIKSYE